MTRFGMKNSLWAGCWIAAALHFPQPGLCAERGGEASQAGIHVEVELVDSVNCWCSPLWGHNAPKIVEGMNGEAYVALFSGEYPEANVQILKRTIGGVWERGRTFRGAYQPSLLFVDGEGFLNVIQNSQTKPLVHFRSTDKKNLENFETVAEGNGQEDGRGWYVGAGVRGDTVYMAYITLSYDLFLTWKHVSASRWNTAVLIHKGSVDAVKGNHSWTRPRLQFSGDTGIFVVNETSDGSVKNSYNAVQLVTFTLSDPRRFTTECIVRVPQGFGAYSSDLAVTQDGWMHCVIERNPRIYDSPFTLDGETGVFVYSRPVGGTTWTASRTFAAVSDGGLFLHEGGTVTALRVVKSAPPDDGIRKDLSNRSDPGSWEAVQSRDHGVTWSTPPGSSSHIVLTNPSHIQLMTGASSWSGKHGTQGIFEDNRGSLPGTKLSRYGLYYFRINGGNSQ